MKNTKATKKRLLTEAHEMAKSLHDASVIDKITMREFDALCLPTIKALSPRKIKSIRESVGVSQPILAKIINVSLAAIKQWERGERKPSGPALKLLHLIANKGLDSVI